MRSLRAIVLVLLRETLVSALILSGRQTATNITGNASALQTSPGEDTSDDPYAITFEELVLEGFANVDRFFPSQGPASPHWREVLVINAFPTRGIGARASDYRYLRLLSFDIAHDTLVQEYNSQTITGLWFSPEACSLVRPPTRLRRFSFIPSGRPLRIGLAGALYLLRQDHALYGPWQEMRMISFEDDPYGPKVHPSIGPTEVYYAFRVARVRDELWWLVGSRTQRVVELYGALDNATNVRWHDDEIAARI